MDIQTQLNFEILDNAFAWANRKIRLVGGCVRDDILGKEPKDFDFCTTATPDEMIKICDRFQLQYIPTGLQHGTITIIVNFVPYEVTTLRKDTECDGRHAKVEFTDDWREDARRRDFTFNAMSMDVQGQVYDYFNGQHDLIQGRIRFVGDTEERIQEDWLRIMRYFRFYGQLDVHVIDEYDADIIRKYAKELDNISVERLWMELKKILALPNAAKVLKYMHECEVNQRFGLDMDRFTEFQFVSMHTKHPVVRLVSLMHDDTLDWFASYFKLDNNSSYILRSLGRLRYMSRFEMTYSEMAIRMDDSEIVRHLMTYRGDDPSTLVVPVFPLRGQDFVDRGMVGKEIGQEMSRLKEVWIDSAFTKTKDELLNGG